MAIAWLINYLLYVYIYIASTLLDFINSNVYIIYMHIYCIYNISDIYIIYAITDFYAVKMFMSFFNARFNIFRSSVVFFATHFTREGQAYKEPMSVILVLH